jgi:hypothetical protein
MAALPPDTAPERSSFSQARTTTGSPGNVSREALVVASPTISATLQAASDPDSVITPTVTAVSPTEPAPAQSAAVAPSPTDAPLQNALVTDAENALVTDEELILPTPRPLSNLERWRAQQENREVFASLRTYTTPGSELWWYDPVNQQHVILGTFSGTFTAQAEFTLANRDVSALEVPYQVNSMYGLTSLSPAFVQRIREAGYTDWIETYVINDERVQPR